LTAAVSALACEDNINAKVAAAIYLPKMLSRGQCVFCFKPIRTFDVKTNLLVTLFESSNLTGC
jgi:hypothetical protein